LSRIENRYGASAGVASNHCCIVACGIFSSSGVNQAVDASNFSKTDITRWNRAATAWSRVSTSRCNCG
jgi:L-fucose isomerase-like protein